MSNRWVNIKKNDLMALPLTRKSWISCKKSNFCYTSKAQVRWNIKELFNSNIGIFSRHWVKKNKLLLEKIELQYLFYVNLWRIIIFLEFIYYENYKNIHLFKIFFFFTIYFYLYMFKYFSWIFSYVIYLFQNKHSANHVSQVH